LLGATGVDFFLCLSHVSAHSCRLF
jgi:hypothetical protein